jgi:hypothetical protein
LNARELAGSAKCHVDLEEIEPFTSRRPLAQMRIGGTMKAPGSAEFVSTRLTARAASQGLRRVLIVVAAMGLTATVGGPVYAENIVTNGNFGTGDFTGWDGSVVSDPFNSVVCPGVDVVPGGCNVNVLGAVGMDETLSQSLSTMPGSFYNISFFFQTDGGTPSDFSASFGSDLLTSVTDPVATNGYEQFNFSGVEATSANTVLSFSFRNDPGSMQLAGASVPEPGTMALLGISSIGIWFGRRRKAR